MPGAKSCPPYIPGVLRGAHARGRSTPWRRAPGPPRVVGQDLALGAGSAPPHRTFVKGNQFARRAALEIRVVGPGEGPSAGGVPLHVALGGQGRERSAVGADFGIQDSLEHAHGPGSRARSTPASPRIKAEVPSRLGSRHGRGRARHVSPDFTFQRGLQRRLHASPTAELFRALDRHRLAMIEQAAGPTTGLKPGQPRRAAEADRDADLPSTRAGHSPGPCAGGYPARAPAASSTSRWRGFGGLRRVARHSGPLRGARDSLLGWAGMPREARSAARICAELATLPNFTYGPPTSFPSFVFFLPAHDLGKPELVLSGRGEGRDPRAVPGIAQEPDPEPALARWTVGARVPFRAREGTVIGRAGAFRRPSWAVPARRAFWRRPTRAGGRAPERLRAWTGTRATGKRLRLFPPSRSPASSLVLNAFQSTATRSGKNLRTAPAIRHGPVQHQSDRPIPTWGACTTDSPGRPASSYWESLGYTPLRAAFLWEDRR